MDHSSEQHGCNVDPLELLRLEIARSHDNGLALAAFVNQLGIPPNGRLIVQASETIEYGILPLREHIPHGCKEHVIIKPVSLAQFFATYRVIFDNQLPCLGFGISPLDLDG